MFNISNVRAATSKYLSIKVQSTIVANCQLLFEITNYHRGLYVKLNARWRLRKATGDLRLL